MATIRANCPECGAVEIRADQIYLEISPGGTKGAYSFPCPSCSSIIAKAANKKIIALLEAAGVITSAEEYVENAKRREAPPLTFDDAIDFHAELEEQGIEGFLP